MAIDRDEFRAWLSSREPNAVVGHVRSSTACVLTHYLNETRGGRWSVGCCAVDLGGEHARESEPLPLWARIFMQKIDRQRTVQQSNDSITAREALSALDSVKGRGLDDEVLDLTRISSERDLAMARHPSAIAKRHREQATA